MNNEMEKHINRQLVFTYALLILSAVCIILGIVFVVMSTDTYHLSTTVEFGADFYTYAVRYIANAANAVADMSVNVTLGIGLFFVVMGIAIMFVSLIYRENLLMRKLSISPYSEVQKKSESNIYSSNKNTDFSEAVINIRELINQEMWAQAEDKCKNTLKNYPDEGELFLLMMFIEYQVKPDKFIIDNMRKKGAKFLDSKYYPSFMKYASEKLKEGIKKIDMALSQ